MFSMIIKSIMLFLFVSFFSGEVIAVEKVGVRSGVHAKYSRVVFDWPFSVEHNLSKDNKNYLTVKFSGAADFDLSKVLLSNLPEITSLNIIDNKTIKIGFNSKMGYRSFVVGNKIVIDINMDSNVRDAYEVKPLKIDNKRAKSTNRIKDAIEKERLPEKIKSVQKYIEKNNIKKNVFVDELKKHTEKIAVSDNSNNVTLAPFKIQISSTKRIGAAVFRRGEYFWIVIDDEKKNLRPRIETTSIKKEIEISKVIGDFKRVQLQGGTAFRAKMPKGYSIYPEGGGLIWNFIITPKKSEKTVTGFSKSYDQKINNKGTLVWESKSNRSILKLVDPEIKDEIFIVTVGRYDELSGMRRSFLQFDLLDSYLGLVIRPKIEDLIVMPRKPSGVEIKTKNNLSITPVEYLSLFPTDLSAMQVDGKLGGSKLNVNIPDDFKMIFELRDWSMGGRNEISDNVEALMDDIELMNDSEKVETLLSLTKLYLANNFGAESIGYLKYAASIMPELKKTVDYAALMGAARFINHQFDYSYQNLKDKRLDEYDEIKFWRAANLAYLGDWAQAGKNMPQTTNVIMRYPESLRKKIALDLTEVALKNADVKLAEKYLLASTIAENEKNEKYLASYKYLMGEINRQKGEIERTYGYWEPLTKIEDDYYRVRSTLAYTSLQLDEGVITLPEAISRMESLRYAWRGDELEAAINLHLGMAYMEYGDYLKGLSILRNIAPFFSKSIIGNKIADLMRRSFYDLFLGDKQNVIDPLDAITVYEEFRELTPAGKQGDVMAQSLANRLIRADLLGRASKILKHLIDHRLHGNEAGDTALTLVAVYLMDGEYQNAIDTLEFAEDSYARKSLNKDKLKEIILFRSKANSKLGQHEIAMNDLLSIDQDIDVLKMRADISWQTAKWSDSSDALKEIVREMGIKRGKALTENEAEVILNWAISLNLAGNRTSLNSVAKMYGDEMAETSYSKQFDVITRERRSTVLASRNVIDKMVKEVDIFKDFMEVYMEKLK